MNTSPYISPELKVGILGGGQLARMLALSGHRLGLIPIIFSESKDDPAAQVTPHHFSGKISDSLALGRFIESCDIVTFESEFIDGVILSELSKKLNKNVLPDPLLMSSLRDRLYQKEFFKKYKLPTASYRPIASKSELDSAFKELGKKLVLKKRLFGYDGYGTYFLSSGSQLDPKINLQDANGYIAEETISFKRELALIIARDQFGTFVSYPLVESRQTQARCDWVRGPEKHPKLLDLIKKLKKFLAQTNYVGVMGIELFDTGGELLINEIAPRVHNTGHYTESACDFDQFLIHMMCVTGYKIPQPKILAKGFAMTNLIGSQDGHAHWDRSLKSPLFWYGKRENRPGRKMGHINSIDKNPKIALKLALQARTKVKI